MLIFSLSRNNVIVFGPEMLTGWAGQSPDLLAPERAFARCGFPLEGPRRNMREICVKPFSVNHIKLDTVTSCIDMILLVKRARTE